MMGLWRNEFVDVQDTPKLRGFVALGKLRFGKLAFGARLYNRVISGRTWISWLTGRTNNLLHIGRADEFFRNDKVFSLRVPFACTVPVWQLFCLSSGSYGVTGRHG